MVPARSPQQPTLLSVAILTALLANSSAGIAANSCQEGQIDAARNLIYQNKSLKEPKPPGILGCDIEAKKTDVAKSDCDSGTQGFLDTMKATKSQQGCTFNFESKAIFNRWKSEINSFRDLECITQKCADGRKRRRSRQMDLIYATEARNLLNSCKSKNGKQLKVSSNFDRKINNLLGATPGLINPDNGEKRKNNLIKSIKNICEDIASRSAITTTVEGEKIPGDTAINLIAAKKDPQVDISVNEDPSNILKSAKKVEVEWGKNDPKDASPDATGSNYRVNIPAKDILEDKESCKPPAKPDAACDNQQVDLSIRFIGGNGLLYKESRKIWVDVEPPQIPKFPASSIELVTMSRDNKIVAVFPDNADNDSDNLRIKGSVSGFRAASQTDNTFHNEAEANLVTVTLGDCNGNSIENCIEKKGFKEQTTSEIEPKDVGSWESNQEFTTAFSASELTRFATPEGREVDISSYLEDYAENQGGIANGKIKFIQEIPPVASITPVGDQSCDLTPGVYNIKSNSISVGGVKVALPDGILVTDTLAINYRKKTAPENEAIPVTGSPWQLQANQKEAAIVLNFESLPNSDRKEDGVATLSGIIQNGNEKSKITEAYFLVDLVAPIAPEFTDTPNYIPNETYKFKVTTKSSSDNLSVTATLSSGESRAVTCEPLKDSTERTCTYSGSSAVPTLTAYVKDWACNESGKNNITPTRYELPPPRITMGLKQCGQQQVYNIKANNESGVRVTDGTSTTNPAMIDDEIEGIFSPPANLKSSKRIVSSIAASGTAIEVFKWRIDNQVNLVDNQFMPEDANGGFIATVTRESEVESSKRSFYIDLRAPQNIIVDYMKAIAGGESDIPKNDHCEYSFKIDKNSTDDQIEIIDPIEGETDPVGCENSMSITTVQSIKCKYPAGQQNKQAFKIKDWACNESKVSLTCPETGVPSKNVTPDIPVLDIE